MEFSVSETDLFVDDKITIKLDVSMANCWDIRKEKILTHPPLYPFLRFLGQWSGQRKRDKVGNVSSRTWCVRKEYVNHILRFLSSPTFREVFKSLGRGYIP